MQIDVTEIGESLYLKLSGSLETSTAPMLQEVVDEKMSKISELQMDMENISYVSSAGLRVLLAASKKMESKHGKMIVSNVNDNVMEVFEITGFDGILDIR